MVGLIKGRQRIGKTTWMVAIALWLCWFGGYKPGDIIANFHLYNDDGTELEGYHYLNNQQMRVFIGQMISKGIRHKIILVDEIDRVFSHRTWQNAEQLNALIGLWQDEKCHLWVLGTAHIGLSVDSLIREIAQIIIIVNERNIFGDYLGGICINALNKEIFGQQMHHLKLVQKCFDSWEAVI